MIKLAALVLTATIADPPMVIMVDRAAVVITPANTEIVIPAGSRIEACTNEAGNTLSYSLPAKVVRVLKPCRDPNVIFKDGFE